MAKVLRILNRFNVGGPTHNATYLTKFLSPDYETKLIAGKKLDSEASSEYILEKYSIDYFIVKNMNRSLNLVKDIKAFFEIRKIIKEYKPDIVHTHASKSGALGRLAAISMKVPIIIHTFHGHVFHSYFGKLKTYIYILIERYLAKKSSAIIAISDLQKNEISKDFAICLPEKISVIPLGFDLDKFQNNIIEERSVFRNEFMLSDDFIAIGIIGRLTSIKNHELFIRSIHQVLPIIKNKIKVFIVGNGEDKEDLLNLSKSLNLSTSTLNKRNTDALIQFISWRSDMTTVYAGLDIVALTSLNEGTPVTLIEAQAAKKPIVTTDVGGVRDIVIKDKTGLICDSQDINGFANNLQKLIENKDLRDSLGAAGYENVYEKFNYRRLVSDVKSLYNRLENEY
ncbi:glycosyltransferase [Gammaproteobacteria bacterium]|nr:glycosyltransferase [Gammaproteobacteria bacterium]